MAIPVRPALPAFLNDAIQPPAPAAPAAGAIGLPMPSRPGARVSRMTPFLKDPNRSSVPTTDSDKALYEKLAAAGKWPLWMRTMFGLSTGATPAPAAPAVASTHFPLLNSLLSP